MQLLSCREASYGFCPYFEMWTYFFGKHQNASYFHICEGAPALDDSKNNHLTGKLIASLITDFMKAKMG